MHLALGIRDRVAVRVEPGPPEPLVDALEQSVAQRVLEHLGLVVHFVPRIAELAHQPRLDEPVAADDGGRAVLARGGQRDRTVRAMRHEALSGELLHHLGHARGGEAELAASCDGVMRSSCHSVWW